ncbi:MAG: Phosphate transport system permease protein PstA, partial [uncultured Solirubrobacteraceae bacterium]
GHRRREGHHPPRGRACRQRGAHEGPALPRGAAAVPADRRRVPRRAVRHDTQRRRELSEPGLPHVVSVAAAPGVLGRPVRADRDALPHGPRRGLHRAGGGGERGLPRGVRRCHEVVEPDDRDEHPEPRLGAIGGLRDPRARVHRPRSRRHLRTRRRAADPAGRGADARAARPARRDHRLPRGDPRGAIVDPRRVARPGRDAVADDLEAGAPGRAPGHRHRRDPRPLARDRRDRAADPRRGGGQPPLQPGDRRALHRAAGADPQRRRRARGRVPEHRRSCHHRPARHPAADELGGHLPPQPLRDQVV